MRQMTTRGYDFLTEQEGERLFAYDDHTGKRIMPGDIVRGVLTIGVGHTGSDVFPGQTITKEESRALFDKDTDWAEAVVEQNMVGPVGQKPNDNQFNACVSLAFNIGKAGFASSSVVRNWKAGKFKEAGDAIGLWNRDKFGVNSALVARRARETAMFFEPMQNELPKPMPQYVEAPRGAASNNTIKAVAGGVAPPAAGVLVENLQPTVDAVNQAATAAQQAATAWGSVKAALGPLMNGHVLTFIAMAVILGVAAYIGLRIARRIWRGEVAA